MDRFKLKKVLSTQELSIYNHKHRIIIRQMAYAYAIFASSEVETDCTNIMYVIARFLAFYVDEKTYDFLVSMNHMPLENLIMEEDRKRNNLYAALKQNRVNAKIRRSNYCIPYTFDENFKMEDHCPYHKSMIGGVVIY